MLICSFTGLQVRKKTVKSGISAQFFSQTNDTSAGQKDVLCKQVSCLFSIDLHYLKIEGHNFGLTSGQWIYRIGKQMSHHIHNNHLKW